MRTLDLPRDLRTLARREAPADGARQVQGGTRGRGRACRVSETEPGAPRSVAIWIPEDYEAYTTAALAELNPLAPRARDLKRFFFNNSHEVELDSANRLMIPVPLLAYAGLDKEVVVTGSGECLEVWDRAAHAAYNEGVLSRVHRDRGEP